MEAKRCGTKRRQKSKATALKGKLAKRFNDCGHCELKQGRREFVTGLINRLDSGDVKNVGTELLAEFKRALTPEVLQKGYRLGDVLCQGTGAETFNEALACENKSPLHLICAGYALSQEGKKGRPRGASARYAGFFGVNTAATLKGISSARNRSAEFQRAIL